MHKITTSIAYATQEQQWVKECIVPRGASVIDLIEQSGFLNEIKDLANTVAEELIIGVYAKKVSLDTLLEEGDRVEIYRPLTADPKEVRRQLALLGKTIGKKSS